MAVQVQKYFFLFYSDFWLNRFFYRLATLRTPSFEMVKKKMARQRVKNQMGVWIIHFVLRCKEGGENSNGQENGISSVHESLNF